MREIVEETVLFSSFFLAFFVFSFFLLVVVQQQQQQQEEGEEKKKKMLLEANKVNEEAQDVMRSVTIMKVVFSSFSIATMRLSYSKKTMLTMGSYPSFHLCNDCSFHLKRQENERNSRHAGRHILCLVQQEARLLGY